MTAYEVNQAVARIHASVANVDWTQYRAGGVSAQELAENEEFFTRWAKDQARRAELEAIEALGFDCDSQFTVTDEDRAILEEARLAGNWDFYSDYFKDCYGFRPRW